jgi:hypothetical protein
MLAGQPNLYSPMKEHVPEILGKRWSQIASHLAPSKLCTEGNRRQTAVAFFA